MKKTKALAEKLNGREIGDEITSEDAEKAKRDGLIVIFGASDDLAQLCGAVYDEVGVFDGGVIAFHDGELLTKKCDNDDCPHEENLLENAKIVKAQWCPDNDGISWKYQTEVPHETFDIMEDGQVYCRGIVIDQRDLL